MRLGVSSPRRVLAAWLLVCLCSVPGLLRLTIEASTESVLDKAATAWSVYQESLDIFGGDEVIVVAFQSDMPYDGKLLAAVDDLTQRFEVLEGVRRVDSITSQPVIRLDANGDLDLTPATEGLGKDPDVDGSTVRERARVDRILSDTLVSADGTVLAVNLVLERDPVHHYGTILDAVAAAVAERHENFARVWVSGVPVFQRETSLQTRRELFALAPLAVVAIGGLLVLSLIHI